jgi:hypothetical protein
MKRARRHLGRNIFSKHDIKREKAPAGPSFEALETRVLLSGNVMASVVHGNLNIRGDTEANAIVLDQTGLDADQVRISGASNTTINNLAGPVTLSDIMRNVDIRMGAGDDSVTMNSLGLPGNVSVNAQGGVNTLTLNNVQVAISLNIPNSSSLSTNTTIANTTVGKDLIIRPGSGGDNITLRSVEVQRNTKISSGGGADTLTVDNAIFHGAVRLNTGQGADIIQIETNGGPLGPPTLFDGPVSILLSAGDDTLQLGVTGQTGNRSTFADRVRFNGGAGHDTLLNLDASTYTGTSQLRVVNFESNTPIPDTTAPTVSSTDPANNATGVARNQKIVATFSEAMDPLTIIAANVTVTAPGPVPVTGTVDYVGTTMTFTPTSTLAPDTLFIMTITTGAEDLAGNPLANNFVWSFTTGATLDTTAPTVSSTDPLSGATGVALNKKIAAIFSEAMDPLTIIAANVTVTAPGLVPVIGTVAYVGTTMTFTPTSTLAPNTTFTATVTTGAKDLAGNPLASNFTWTFRTGATSDTTAPTVSSTDPLSGDTGVALNKKIAAIFSEAMDPLTITTTNFTVTGPGSTPVIGTVAYVGTTATFTPTLGLAPNTTFTATVTTGAKDMAGNPLASNFTWTFRTGATSDITAPTVTSTNPTDLQPDVVLNKTVAGTFSKSMDPLTITTTNFTVKGPGITPVMGTVNYDALSKTATFTPSSNLAPNTTFTATIAGGVSGVKDLAGNPLASDFTWTFMTGTQLAQAPINLGAAGAFAVMATASISSTGPTQINGDVGLNPGSAQGIPPAQVNGTIHVDDQAVIAAQADLLAAYNDAISRSVGSIDLPGNMGGSTFAPGLYTNSTSVLISGAGPGNNVTLDAQGDPNAIFIFKMGSTLTTGPGAQVILAGGAKASNIFWQVGSSATLNTTTIFKGNILASVTITVNTGSVVEGRLLGGSNSDGSVTINASTITVPVA